MADDKKKTAADSVDDAFLDMVKKATTQFLDGLGTAAGDEREEAGNKARFETALRNFKRGRETCAASVREIFG